jgi:hypothetical protein
MQGGINFQKSDTYALGKFFKLGSRSTVRREGVPTANAAINCLTPVNLGMISRRFTQTRVKFLLVSQFRRIPTAFSVPITRVYLLPRTVLILRSSTGYLFVPSQTVSFDAILLSLPNLTMYHRLRFSQ